MAPKDKTVFLDPLDVSEFINQPGAGDPGFTKDVIDILGNAGDPSDGFDALLQGAGVLVDAWDAAVAAADSDLDALLALNQHTDTAPLDNSFAAFEGTIPYGEGLVSAATQLTPPQLLELPLTADMVAGGIVAPATQSQVDLGTLKLGATPLAVLLGTGNPVKAGISGISNVSLPTGDPAIYKLKVVQGNPVEVEIGGGNHYKAWPYTYTLVVTPSKPGTFIAQVNSTNSPHIGFNIVNYTVTVVP